MRFEHIFSLSTNILQVEKHCRCDDGPLFGHEHSASLVKQWVDGWMLAINTIGTSYKQWYDDGGR